MAKIGDRLENWGQPDLPHFTSDSRNLAGTAASISIIPKKELGQFRLSPISRPQFPVSNFPFRDMAVQDVPCFPIVLMFAGAARPASPSARDLRDGSGLQNEAGCGLDQRLGEL